ncbi:MAG: glycosyltransferase family 39 protein [Actinomycetota bacterium]|nr:glycosyltransferase family 39 protein [Actinomycetota bacterium]
MVATQSAAGVCDDVRAGSNHFIARLIVALPTLVTAAATGLAIPLMGLLLLARFAAPWTLPLALVGAVAAVVFCGLPRGRVTLTEVRCCAGALAFAAGWLAYNVQYTAQDVYNTRDPAGYTISARWLVAHSSLMIHAHPEVFGSPIRGEIASGSFAQVGPDTINAQGNHLLPAMLGFSGSLFGQGAVFRTNVVIGALALIVLYGLAARIVSAPWALLVTVGLGVSMPYVYVSRDNYSEPLTMLFLVGALALLHRGLSSRRTADFALAGLAAGSATMVRVDTYGALIGLVFAAASVAALAPASLRRAAAARALVLLTSGAAAAALGWLDVTHLARQYFGSQHHNIILSVDALGAAIILAPVGVWLGWRPRVMRFLGDERTRRRGAAGAATLVVLAFAFLASRPLWQITRGPFHADLINMQAVSGVAADGTRTYNEQTVHWLALYFGWPTVLLGVAGYVWLIFVMVRRRAYQLIAMLATGLSMSALYLWNCEVSPDQPWAMRRYVPVVLPLMLIAAAAALRWLWRSRSPAHGDSPSHPARGAVRAGVVIAAALLVGVPAATSWPMRHVREEVPQFGQVQALCSAIGPEGAVMLLDAPVIFGYGQTLRSYCDVPTIGLVNASASELADANRAVRAHGRTLFVLAEDDAGRGEIQMATGLRIDGFSTVRVSRWPTTINRAPSMSVEQQYTMWLVSVDASGVAHAVAPARAG